MEKACPSCGHCPTCGRGGYLVVPVYVPMYPALPAPVWPWEWMQPIQMQPNITYHFNVGNVGAAALAAPTFTGYVTNIPVA